MAEVISKILLRSSRPDCNGKRAEMAGVAERVFEPRATVSRRSSPCSMASQLACCTAIPGGLLGYYRQPSFVVLPRPVEAHRQPPLPVLPPGGLTSAYSDFLNAAKPMLVHCSAWCDRTGAVANYQVAGWQRRTGSSALAEKACIYAHY